MMSTEFSGNESPSQCLPSEFENSLSSHDADRSFYDSTFYPNTLTSFDKAFTFEGDKVFTNLSPLARPTSLSPTNQLLPNMDHRALNQLPSIGFFSKNHNNNGRHDSGMSSPSSQYGSPSSPIRTPPPTFSATPMVRQTWASKHLMYWTSEDTLDWVIEVAHKNNIGDETRSEAFQEYTGMELMSFTEEGFRPLSLTHYRTFYEHFNQLRKRSSFKGPEAEGPLLSSTSEHLYDSYSNGPCGFDDSMAEPTATTSHLIDSAAVIQLDKFNYPVDLSDNFPEVPVTHHQQHQQQHQQHQQQQPEGASDDGYSSAGSERNNVITHTHFTHPDMNKHFSAVPHARIPNPVIDRMEDEEDEEEEEQEEDILPMEDCGPLHTDPKKKPEGRTRGRKPGQTTRGNHLWEFVRDLLKDARFTPTLIKWENRELGIFRFVQSAAVAKMWGRRKNNLTMNYEKLSRAMRFCRDKKYFAALPEKGKYPKKLCFRFGERAFGWQTDD